ncbi:MAG: hypothetical protein M1833_000333 [Piccolia ochrophora]|nr:MAG: hypothetical protein M1833_000333 [Piccolia ochrophora]
MTTYFSSYFIDPVLRHARHFSRFTDPLSACYNPLSTPEHEMPSEPRDASHPENIATTDVPRDQRFVVSDTISGQPVVASPTREDVQLGHGHPVHPPTGNLGRRATDERQASSLGLGSGSLPGRHSLDLVEARTGNPEYGIPERFASPNPFTTPSFSHASSTRSSVSSRTNVGGTLPPRNTYQATEQAPTEAQGLHSTDPTIPANDGQRMLREKIVEIRDSSLSNIEKARLMHLLMTEQYYSSQASGSLPHLAPPHSPPSFRSQDRPVTPGSVNSDPSHLVSPPTPSSSTEVGAPILNVSLDDLKPTYVPQVVRTASNTRSSSDSLDVDGEDGPQAPALGCRHYKRNVKLQCSACSRWYTCRFCHDEVEDHSLNRRETKNMLCMLCGSAQPAGESCNGCGERSAWYYCGICKLWDDDSEKSIYHCADCGICRIGRGLGKDFYHCKRCCVCMSISIAQSHKCIERSTDCDCPICGEYMFNSPLTVVFMPCGHSIHHQCYYDHMKTSYRCPICSRSIVNMETQFRNLDRAIESQPMPPQFQDTKALVYCNDCCAKSSVKYHWLGLKCSVCDSYNTAQIQILSGPDPEGTDPSIDTELIRLDAVRRFQTTTIADPPPTVATVPAVAANHDNANDPSDRPIPPPTDTTNPTPLPAYIVPQGLSPSASPTQRPVDPGGHLVNDDNDNEEMNFWGGEVGGDRTRSGSSTVAPADKDENDESDESMDENRDPTSEDDDDDDDTDEMELFGHR